MLRLILWFFLIMVTAITALTEYRSGHLPPLGQWLDQSRGWLVEVGGGWRDYLDYFSPTPEVAPPSPEQVAIAQLRETTLPALEQRIARLEQQLATELSVLNGEVARITAQELPPLVGRVTTLEQATSALAAVGTPRLASGRLVVSGQDQGWQLADMFTKLRVLRKRVPFGAPFGAPPQVVVGIAGVDLSQGSGQLGVAVTRVDTAGFEVSFSSISDARAKEITIDWLAYHSAAPVPAAPVPAAPVPAAPVPAAPVPTATSAVPQ